jgi:beta-1,4-mannosyltransferase
MSTLTNRRSHQTTTTTTSSSEYSLEKPNNNAKKIITIIVIGDIGRSPRMQYHTLSLTKHLDEFSLIRIIGLPGESCLDELQQNKNVLIQYLHEIKYIQSLPYLIRAPLRASINFLQLTIELCRRDVNSDIILMQNPPALPTMLSCLITRWYLGSRIIIDWHNLSYKMLQHGGRLPPVLVQIAQKYEEMCSEQCDAHISVTFALKQFLEKKFELPNVSVVYDRSHVEFNQARNFDTSNNLVDFKQQLLQRLCLQDKVLPSSLYEIRNDVAWLLSSTSWTPDEDFSILIDGLKLYASTNTTTTNNSNNSSTMLPRLVVIITGKGPLKKSFEEKFEQFNKGEYGKKVLIYTAWLSHADYPRLLSICDLGISMHTSTSGLDLPMKVVDMYGAGIPVIAMKFKCLSELVQDGSNGYVFSNSQELYSVLKTIFMGFSSSPSSLPSSSPSISGGKGGAGRQRASTPLLDKMRIQVQESENKLGDWEKNWELNAWPVIRQVLDQGRVSVRERLWIFILCGYFIWGWIMFVIWQMRK